MAAEVNDLATALAVSVTATAAAEALTAIRRLADLEDATRELEASIAAAMSMPHMPVAARLRAESRAGDIAAAMGRGASTAAAHDALERAIVSRAVADAAAEVVASAAADARTVLAELSTSVARMRADAPPAART